MDTLSALSQYFGHSAFRPGQDTLVDALLSGRDALGVMPTGAGKSVCYQLPALLLSGITLVISPLISLMKDQVTALQQCGVPAAYLNSSLSAPQQAEVLYRAGQGAYKLLYVAPERLLTERFLAFARRVTISMVTVDEAHCISQWGQDFRPSYLSIKTLIDALPTRPVVSAFTATATPQVREDIIALLGLRDPCMVMTSFDRKNLFFGVEIPEDKEAALLRFLDRHRGESGIIYCISRRSSEELCHTLRRLGLPAACYHAGLTQEVRRQNQEDFLYDRATIMVATNAFGMGIDKSNVSFILHYHMPRDLESYYQEAGRAGRDGSPAECLLFFRKRDILTNKFLLQKNRDEADGLDKATSALLYQRNLRRLNQMASYCTAPGCLRRTLLSYFGETLSEDCGNCSSCLRRFEAVDVTVDAQMLLSCVLRIRQQGLRPLYRVVQEVLLGTASDAVTALKLDGLSTFGLMKGRSPEALDAVKDALITHGFLAVREDGCLTVAEKAKGLLRGQRALTVRRPRRQKLSAASPARPNADPVLLDALKATRAALANRAGVPAYVICSDAALKELCRKRPVDLAGLRQIDGFTAFKVEKYGSEFLAALRRQEQRRK